MAGIRPYHLVNEFSSKLTAVQKIYPTQFETLCYPEIACVLLSSSIERLKQGESIEIGEGHLDHRLES